MGDRRAPRDEPEQIAPLHRTETRVKIIGDLHRLHDGNRMRFQVEIQRLAQAERVPVTGQIDRRHLPRAMHTRIGATGGGNGMIARFQLGQSRFNRSLHRRLALRLTLPALIGATVILNFQRKSWHVPPLAHRPCTIHAQSFDMPPTQLTQAALSSS